MTAESWIAGAARGRDSRLSRLHAAPAGEVLRPCELHDTSTVGFRSSSSRLCVLLVAKPLGHLPRARLRRLAHVARRRSSASIYRVCGVDPTRISTGRATPAACCCSASRRCCSRIVVLRLQHVLPLNPQHLAAVTDRQAFETAASFTTNTNWQSYVGESTMSYFSQMTQLAFHNFVSAAVGMAVAVAFVRGIARQVGGPARQLLGRPRARHAVRAAAALARARRCCSCSRA